MDFLAKDMTNHIIGHELTGPQHHKEKMKAEEDGEHISWSKRGWQHFSQD